MQTLLRFMVCAGFLFKISFACATEEAPSEALEETLHRSFIVETLREAAKDQDTQHHGFRAKLLSDGRILLAGHFENSEPFGQFPVEIAIRLDPDFISVEVTGMVPPSGPESPNAHRSRHVKVKSGVYLTRFAKGQIHPTTALDDLVAGVSSALVVDNAKDCIGSLVRAEF